MPIYAHVYSVLRISYMHVHSFVWEKLLKVTDHSAFHVHGLQLSSDHLLTYVDVIICRCAVVPLSVCVLNVWDTESQQFQRSALWITFAASHQWSQNAEGLEFSAGREQLLTNEWGGTVQAARHATQQLQNRASPQSVCEWCSHKMMCLEVCFF